MLEGLMVLAICEEVKGFGACLHWLDGLTTSPWGIGSGGTLKKDIYLTILAKMRIFFLI